MEEEDITINENFPLFTKPPKKLKPLEKPKPKPSSDHSNVEPQIEKSTDANPSSSTTTFEELGLGDWAVKTCTKLGMRKPTAVQAHCIPRFSPDRMFSALLGPEVERRRLSRCRFYRGWWRTDLGVFALVITPTRGLAHRLAEQFRALGLCLHLRCSVIVGGMDMLTQTKSLITWPHVVIASPGRVKVLLEINPDIPAVFSRTKFLVLDEADRGFGCWV